MPLRCARLFFFYNIVKLDAQAPPIFSAKHLFFILTLAPTLRLYIISFFENYSMRAPSVGGKKDKM
jgi:hypothetical protein